MRAAPFLVLLLLSSLPAHAADLSGEWTVTSPLWALPHVCTFRQNGGRLTGACTGPQAQGRVLGNVTSRDIAFDWQGSRFSDSTTLRWQFSGHVDADAIRGTLVRGGRRAFFLARRTLPIS